MKRQRFDKQGLLALEPKAFFMLFADAADRANERIGDAEIVSIEGPLDHHAGWWCDSYDSILERVEEACASDAKRVVLKIDSPGGLVSGCFETARSIRTKCEAAGKTLVAYVDGSACSAAYALASSSESIYVSETSFVGSIGVIDTRVDITKMDADWGVKYSFITSGARKADGNPHLPMSKDELDERQSIVDGLAGLFFGMVAEMRGGMAAEYKALEARVFFGAGAVSAGLADDVRTFDQLLADLASPESEKTMSLANARKALEKAAKGEGEEAEKAKRALAAMDGKAEDEKKDDEEKAESDDEEKVEGDDEKKKDEESESEGDDDDDEEKAEGDDEKDEKKDDKGSSASSVEGRLAALEADRVESFLATRPDLTKEQRASVAGLPIDRVRAIVNAIPKSKPKHNATVAPTATRAAGQGEAGVLDTSDPELLAVDRAMGFGSEPVTKAERRGNTVYLGRAPASEKT